MMHHGNIFIMAKIFQAGRRKNGEAPFKAVDSIIIGTTILNTPNSFLCTDDVYSDFIMEFDFLVDAL